MSMKRRYPNRPIILCNIEQLEIHVGHRLTKWYPYWLVQESILFMLRVNQVKRESLGKKYALFARYVNGLFI